MLIIEDKKKKKHYDLKEIENIKKRKNGMNSMAS